MSYTKGLAEKIGDEPTLTTKIEPSVRPKVMRRPAHFSTSSPTPTMPTIHFAPDTATAGEAPNENLALAATTNTAPARTTPKPWQDDLPFGVALLTILLLVNIALITGLPHLRHAAAPTDIPTQLARETLAHTPAASAPPLTFYSKPQTAPAPAPEAPLIHTLPSVADSGPEQ